MKSKLRRGAPSDTDTACVFFERMEPRILFSADALGGLVASDPFADNDSAAAGMNVSASAGYLVDLYTQDESSTDSLTPTDAERTLQFDALRAAFDAEESTNQPADSLDTLRSLLDSAESGVETRQEIIFVDADTPDYQQLLSGLNIDSPDTDYQIFILQSDRDGIEQISEILGGFDAVDAIHLVSHGDQTGLQLGSGWLGQATLDDYAASIGSWSAALGEDADLLIYGCNLAAGVAGQQLIGNLAELTGADVAASDDLTGAAALGGDWQFEYSTGDIETGVAITTTAQQTWDNVLATITVTITGDIVDAFDGQTSLREAITLANGLAGLDEIILGADTYTLSITGNDNTNNVGDLDILDHLIIRGAGAASTIIDGNSAVINDTVFQTITNSQATQFSISDLTITNGGATNSDGGALHLGKDDIATLTDVVISGNQAKLGAGIFVNDDASLFLTRVVFSNNIADDYGGAISVNELGTVDGSDVLFSNNSAVIGGGAISNHGSVTLDRGLFDSNHTDGSGGAIYNEVISSPSIVKLSNITLSGNDASISAGAISNIAGGTLNITNSTFDGNSSPLVNGIQQDAGSVVNIQNSILNDGGSNISGGTINSLGNNLDSDGSAGLAGPGDLVGNPMLGGLADNGGFTQTHALLSGSAAIDAGNSTGTPVADQRGQIRMGATDIGAYEFTDYGLIWGDVGTDSIMVASLDGNRVTELISGLNNPASVAIDPDAGKVYWANEGDGKIQRANLDGTGVEDIVTGLSGPIAIDLYLAGGKIYWTDSSGTLLRANLDGSTQEVISSTPNAPTGVAVDGPGGMVYWVDDGSNSIVETSLTGTGTGNLITSSVNNTADLNLDLINGTIYWTNTSTGQLWRANLDGSGVVSLGVGGSPYGLALDPLGNKTYWMDSVAGELYRVDLSNGANRITLYSGLTDPRDVDFFTMTNLIKSPTNNPPTATNLDSTSVYNEGDASVAITDIVVSDVDVGEIIKVSLSLNNPATGSLSANDGATYNPVTGEWALTDTVANVNTALANLVFNPNVNNDVNTTISVSIDDGD
ncbi:MAG: DUF4347 domain-containing protein, partial [Gammaproteobacteria bacterium]|nr:DUF4347 domain-containing protein [Gammaproteobacteria bacterium]